MKPSEGHPKLFVNIGFPIVHLQPLLFLCPILLANHPAIPFLVQGFSSDLLQEILDGDVDLYLSLLASCLDEEIWFQQDDVLVIIGAIPVVWSP